MTVKSHLFVRSGFCFGNKRWFFSQKSPAKLQQGGDWEQKLLVKSQEGVDWRRKALAVLQGAFACLKSFSALCLERISFEQSALGIFLEAALGKKLFPTSYLGAIADAKKVHFVVILQKKL